MKETFEAIVHTIGSKIREACGDGPEATGEKLTLLREVGVTVLKTYLKVAFSLDPSVPFRELIRITADISEELGNEYESPAREGDDTGGEAGGGGDGERDSSGVAEGIVHPDS